MAVGPVAVATSSASKTTRWSSRIWLPLVAVTLLAAGLIPLLYDPRYYFNGDSQAAYLGWWFHLGEQVRQGDLPLLDVQSWRAGNFAAEGQLGLFSPLTIAIGVAASLASDFVLFVSIVKIAIIVVAGIGTFLVARSYGVHPAGAYVAGVAAQLGGMSQYKDWASWTNGQIITALLPWAWWATRRTLVQAANPWPALLVSYLLVTVGYVYGALYLAVVIAGCLLEAWLTGNRRGGLRALAIGVIAGLLAIAVYLPGILTAPVTKRGALDVTGLGRGQAEVIGLFASMLPFAVTPGRPRFPLHYVAWFLPVLTFVRFSRLADAWRELSGMIFILSVMTVWTLGPSQVGPIRWPMRNMPVVVLVLVLLTVVVLSRAGERRPSPTRLLLSLAWVITAGYVVMSRARNVRVLEASLASLAVTVLGVAVIWGLVRWRREARGPRLLSCPRVAAFIGAWCLLLVAVQHFAFPDGLARQRNMPRLAADYRHQLAAAEGDTLVLGDPDRAAARDPSVARELLVGSLWYVTGHPVHNSYTTIHFRAYSRQFCMNLVGHTCPDALPRLFRREPVTGERWVDLLSVSTLILFRPDFPATQLMNPEPGWRVARAERWSVTWVRDAALSTAGGVVWTSPGVRVAATLNADRTVRLRVDDVPAAGGTVVLSRLAWPGYRVDGARLADPLGDQLLRIDIGPEASGDEVVLRFSPPGWAFQLGCLFLAVGLAISWSVARWLVGRRKRQLVA